MNMTNAYDYFSPIPKSPYIIMDQIIFYSLKNL